MWFWPGPLLSGSCVQPWHSLKVQVWYCMLGSARDTGWILGGASLGRGCLWAPPPFLPYRTAFSPRPLLPWRLTDLAAVWALDCSRPGLGQFHWGHLEPTQSLVLSVGQQMAGGGKNEQTYESYIPR